eukprot:Rhum_TRINITY_DN9848_c0_g1::Rhum_TRINITY_DN9848_c0_g1_i1::g.35551::m.35551
MVRRCLHRDVPLFSAVCVLVEQIAFRAFGQVPPKRQTPRHIARLRPVLLHERRKQRLLVSPELHQRVHHARQLRRVVHLVEVDEAPPLVRRDAVLRKHLARVLVVVRKTHHLRAAVGCHRRRNRQRRRGARRVRPDAPPPAHRRDRGRRRVDAHVEPREAPPPRRVLVHVALCLEVREHPSVRRRVLHVVREAEALRDAARHRLRLVERQPLRPSAQVAALRDVPLHRHAERRRSLVVPAPVRRHHLAAHVPVVRHRQRRQRRRTLRPPTAHLPREHVRLRRPAAGVRRRRRRDGRVPARRRRLRGCGEQRLLLRRLRRLAAAAAAATRKELGPVALQLLGELVQPRHLLRKLPLQRPTQELEDLVVPLHDARQLHDLRVVVLDAVLDCVDVPDLRLRWVVHQRARDQPELLRVAPPQAQPQPPPVVPPPQQDARRGGHDDGGAATVCLEDLGGPLPVRDKGGPALHRLPHGGPLAQVAELAREQVAVVRVQPGAEAAAAVAARSRSSGALPHPRVVLVLRLQLRLELRIVAVACAVLHGGRQGEVQSRVEAAVGCVVHGWSGAAIRRLRSRSRRRRCRCGVGGCVGGRGGGGGCSGGILEGGEELAVFACELLDAGLKCCGPSL